LDPPSTIKRDMKIMKKTDEREERSKKRSKNNRRNYLVDIVEGDARMLGIKELRSDDHCNALIRAQPKIAPRLRTA